MGFGCCHGGCVGVGVGGGGGGGCHGGFGLECK